MIKRLIAIGFIFGGVSVAWMVLAGATYTRTHAADASLKSRVTQLWGAPQAQLPPVIIATETVVKKVESLEDGKKIVKTVEEKLTEKLTLDSSDIKVGLKLDHRQKGLLWYATYGVDFGATYVLTNTAKVARDIEIALPFPAKRAVFDDLRFELDGAQWVSKPAPGEDKFIGYTRLGRGNRPSCAWGIAARGWTAGAIVLAAVFRKCEISSWRCAPISTRLIFRKTLFHRARKYAQTQAGRLTGSIVTSSPV